MILEELLVCPARSSDLRWIEVHWLQVCSYQVMHGWGFYQRKQGNMAAHSAILVPANLSPTYVWFADELVALACPLCRDSGQMAGGVG